MGLSRSERKCFVIQDFSKFSRTLFLGFYLWLEEDRHRLCYLCSVSCKCLGYYFYVDCKNSKVTIFSFVNLPSQNLHCIAVSFNYITRNIFSDKQKYSTPMTCPIKPERNWVTCHSKLRYWKTVVNFSFWDSEVNQTYFWLS